MGTLLFGVCVCLFNLGSQINKIKSHVFYKKSYTKTKLQKEENNRIRKSHYSDVTWAPLRLQ